jgi:tetratricopeptide (TPR) repeat protein
MTTIFRKSALFLLLLILVTYADSYRFVFFPFKEDKPSGLIDWVSYALPELCFLKLHSISGINVWDPVTLFQIDSSAYLMNNDSVLIKHQNRWEWDIAIGGDFYVDNDTLKVKAKVYWTAGKQEDLKMELKFTSGMENIDSLGNELVFKVLNVVKHELKRTDSIAIRKKCFSNINAYKTFSRGLGFEMYGDNNAAVTAYNRAVELDPEFAYAWCRLSNLYDKNGYYESALKGFEHVTDCKYKDTYTIAAAADFMIEKSVPSLAYKYIEDHRTELEKTAEGKLVIGKEYLAQGEYQRTFAVLMQALASGPSDLEIQFTLGNAYLLAGEYKKATDLFNELVKFDPENLRYYSSLGAAYRNSGSLMESSMILESALKIDPQNTTILVDLAQTFYKLKWYQRARQLLQKAIDIDPQLDIAYVNLGVVYWFEGKKNDARRSFERASTVPVSRRASYNNIGNIFSLEQSGRKAIKAYKKADKSGKKNVTVQYNLAIAYQKARKIKKAVYYFNEVLRLSPERVDIMLQAALLTESLNRLSEAESYYRKILDIYPYHRETIYNFVRILDLNKRFSEAVKPVETYLEHFPSDKDMLVLLCNIYLEMGWYEVAIMKYNFIIRDFPEAAEGYWGVARSMYDLIMFKNAKNYDQAIYALKLASDHSPENPEPDILTGNLYINFKNYKELAIEHFQKALARSKNEKEKKAIREKIALAQKK